MMCGARPARPADRRGTADGTRSGDHGAARSSTAPAPSGSRATSAIDDGTHHRGRRPARRASGRSTPTARSSRPGWVDVHTHYDGQATWDDQLDPSFGNGVTTLVMGNCGVGFAPCPPGEQVDADRADGGRRGHPRQRAARRRAVGRVGDASPSTSTSSRSRHYAMDVAAQVAHGSLRFHVMRERGVRQRGRDRRRHRRRCGGCVAEAIAAGAVGFSTSRTIFHRSIGGDAVPGHLRDRRRADASSCRAWPTAAAACSRRSRRQSLGDHGAARRRAVQPGPRAAACSPSISQATRPADHVHHGPARRRPRGVAHRARLRGRAERGRRAPLPADRVAPGRHPRRARRLPPVHAPARRTDRSPDLPGRRAGPSACAIPR